MTDIFALTTRGLETISAAELAELPGLSVTETAYRRVTAQVDGSLAPLLSLRTVADAYLDLGTWTGISHTRDTLAVIQWYAAQIDLAAAAQTVAPLRPLPAEPLFSVTASFVGKRNYNTDEIKRNVAAAIKEAYGLHYSADDRLADLNVRIFIEHEQAYIGLRLAKSPLHERPYKLAERAGALKPSVAAAMIRLAAAMPGQRLLDPCCGSGTILIEAALLGFAAQGGDSDDEAVAAARSNAQAAGVAVSLKSWDARALPLVAGSVERVVSNLPWGRQIAVDDALERLYAEICAEAERVLAPGGKAVLLTSNPALLRFTALPPSSLIEISLFGQTPTICVFG